MRRPALLTQLLLIGFALLPASSGANPCTHRNRVVNGYAVDLKPLMDWWPEPKGIRPLSGWKHVRGTILRETAFGWVVSGKAEGLPQNGSFLLKNPPRDTLRRFEELNRQLPDYERARTATLEYLKRPTLTDWYSYWLAQPSVPPITLTDYRDASAFLTELDHRITAIHQELASMQDKKGNFRLDAFALRVNESYEGLPVFDHGFPRS